MTLEEAAEALRALADAQGAEIGRGYLRSVGAILDRISVDTLADLIAAGRYQEAIALIQDSYSSVSWAPLRAAIQAAVIAGGSWAAGQAGAGSALQPAPATQTRPLTAPRDTAPRGTGGTRVVPPPPSQRAPRGRVIDIDFDVSNPATTEHLRRYRFVSLR